MPPLPHASDAPTSSCPCDGSRPGLRVLLDYGAPTCGVWDQGLLITLGDVTLTRDNVVCGAEGVADWRDLRFEWPAGVAAGTGMVVVDSGGDGVVARGSQDFAFDAMTCVSVTVSASCCHTNGDAGVCQ